MQPSTSQTAQPVVKPKMFNGKVIASIVLILVGLILAGASLTGVWWSVTSTAGGASDFSLDKACSPPPFGCLTYSQWSSQFPQTKSTQDMFGTTSMMMIVGLILAVLSLILVIVAARKPGLKIGVILVGIISAIVFLVAALYTYSALPAALNEMTTGAPYSSFFGSANVAGNSMTWGGGMGWYLTLGAFVFVLLGMIFAFMGVRKQTLMSPPPPPT